MQNGLTTPVFLQNGLTTNLIFTVATVAMQENLEIVCEIIQVDIFNDGIHNSIHSDPSL